MLKVLVTWACVALVMCRAAKLGQVGAGGSHDHHHLGARGSHDHHHLGQVGAGGSHDHLLGQVGAGGSHDHLLGQVGAGGNHGHHPPPRKPGYNYDPPAQPAFLYEVPAVPSGLYETPVAPPPPPPSGLYQTPDASVRLPVRKPPPVTTTEAATTTTTEAATTTTTEATTTTTTEATTKAMMGGMPYNFDWGVNDPDSGNQFSQNEISDGNIMRGQYSVLLPDGRTQIVNYYDDGHGFMVQLSYE